MGDAGPAPRPVPPPCAGATRDAAWFAARGFSRPVGVDAAGWLSKLTWRWATPLVQRGVDGTYDDATAEAFTSRRDDAAVCEAEFDAAYAKHKAAGSPRPLHRALLTLHAAEFGLMIGWTVVEVGCRVGSALLLRGWVDWLTASRRPGGPPPAVGWALATALVAVNGFYAVTVHHQLFGLGMKAGYIARQRVTTAVHSKLLRLNAASAAAVGGGRVVNLASSDVRRLEDVGPFWPFLVAAPAELLIVAGLLASKLGAAAAFGGVAPILAFLPLQAALSRRIGGLRTATAACTDARARTLAEAVHGALAVKMLGLEPVVARRAARARAREAAPATSAARIRALNLALYYVVYPVSVFFLVLAVWAGGRRPPVADIFFALALLRLPQLYMGIFFMRAVEGAAELAASLARLAAFLALDEPPPPPHAAKDVVGAADVPADVAVAFRGCDFVWPPLAGGDGDGAPRAADDDPSASPPRVVVVAPVADAEPSSPQPPRSSVDAGPNGRSSVDAGPRRSSVDARPAGPALAGVTLTIQRGELVAIAGDVGAGKSALLQALLAELIPVGPPATHPFVRGTVSYCAQTPWIVSGTLKDNIVGFGGDGNNDPDRYAAAIDAASLARDIALLPGGDATEIGERGVNLSGGQRARVALARAAHARADVALLDDPLSALDARVGAAVFTRCVGPGSALDGTTRILVTHARHYLPRCDRVVILRGGRVAHVGTPAELAAAGVPELAPSATAAPVDVDAAADAAGDLDGAPDDDDVVARGASPPPLAPITQADVPPPPPPPKADDPQPLPSPTKADDAQPLPSPPKADDPQPLPSPTKTKKKDGVPPPSVFTLADAPPAASRARRADAAADRLRRELSRLVARGGRSGGDGTGSVSASVPGPWRSLVRGLSRATSSLLPRAWSAARSPSNAGPNTPAPPPSQPQRAPPGALTSEEGRARGGVALGVYAAWLRRVGAAQCAVVAATLVVGQAAYLFAEWWSSTLGAVGVAPTAGATAVVAGRPVDARLWLAVYGGVTAALVAIAVGRAQLFFGAAVAAATRLHDDMAAATLRAPLAFYHTTPAGRILNRFTKDQGIADDYLPMVAFDACQSAFLVVGAVAMMAVAVPAVLPVFLPLAAAFAYFRRRYLAATRDVKRFDGTTRSPVFAALGETPRGLATVRAYGAAPRFRDKFAGLAGRNLSWWAAFVACARHLGVRLDAVATAALAAEAALLTGLAPRVDPRLAGLALTNSVGLAGALQWAVRQVAEWEVSMTSVERMLELTRLPAEPPTRALGGRAPPPGWPPHGGVEFERVTATYRPPLPPVLVDVSLTVPPGSSIGICGRTGSGKSSLLLALFRLIPVTAGTVRVGGVDAASIALDSLRSAIAVIPQDPLVFSGSFRHNLDPAGAHDDAALWSALRAARLKSVVTRLGGLSAPLTEGGANLSVGERQLLCLARALLADAAVLALDEATANIDAESDRAVGDAVARARGRAAAKGRTLLVIAHRIDTVMGLDAVAVLGAGRVLEAGPPRELVAKGGGPFARLVAAAAAARRGG